MGLTELRYTHRLERHAAPDEEWRISLHTTWRGLRETLLAENTEKCIWHAVIHPREEGRAWDECARVCVCVCSLLQIDAIFNGRINQNTSEA